MDAIAVTSYRQLLDEINKLPPPAEGTVRLFRGQTKDYSAILSSLGRTLRTRPAGEWFETRIKQLYIKAGLLSVVGDLLRLPQLGPIDIQVSVANYVLADALVQHYGYQTSYVDVSPSIDVALWFATHRFEGRMDAPFGKAEPFRITFPAWHVAATEPGVVYVLDAKPWDRVSAIDDGQYVDLVPIAPEGVNRPRRQVGGLLHAPAWGAGRGDVSGLLRTKFAIRFQWEEAGKEWSTDYVFPGPAEDPIYQALLRAPFFRTVRPKPAGGEETIFRRTCTVPEYCAGPDDAQRQTLYRTYDRRLLPTLYYPWLMRNLDRLLVKEWAPSLLNEFKRAVPIMLQRPGILFNLRRGGPAAPPDKPPGEVPLPFRNFFLEYAPESYAFEYDESRMRRGFWCYWMDGNSFLLQSFGTSEKRPVGMEISAYEWRPEGGLVCKSEPELMGTYVTEPLDLIQMTVDGLLRLVPPGNLGHGYMELTTTEKFWPARSEWTDLL